MVVTEIVVSAGRTFNHPYEQFSILKPSVTLKARIDEGEDWLQAFATRQILRKLEDESVGLIGFKLWAGEGIRRAIAMAEAIRRYGRYPIQIYS